MRYPYFSLRDGVWQFDIAGAVKRWIKRFYKWRMEQRRYMILGIRPLIPTQRRVARPQHVRSDMARQLTGFGLDRFSSQSVSNSLARTKP